MYRHLHGTGSFSLGFFSGLLGCIPDCLRGGVPILPAVSCEHSMIFLACSVYRGITSCLS